MLKNLGVSILSGAELDAREKRLSRSMAEENERTEKKLLNYRSDKEQEELQKSFAEQANVDERSDRISKVSPKKGKYDRMEGKMIGYDNKAQRELARGVKEAKGIGERDDKPRNKDKRV